jgi:hypothetical protein
MIQQPEAIVDDAIDLERRWIGGAFRLAIARRIERHHLNEPCE